VRMNLLVVLLMQLLYRIVNNIYGDEALRKNH